MLRLISYHPGIWWNSPHLWQGLTAHRRTSAEVLDPHLINISIQNTMVIHNAIHVYIYYSLYTNWPITNADFPNVIIQYILYFICQKLYWTVSGQLSNIGYIGQFQNEATGTLRTRYRRTKAVSTYVMKILSILLHLRKILICFRIGWFL